jgi:hypothetical protein
LRDWDVAAFDEDVACGDVDAEVTTGCPFDDAEGETGGLIGDGLVPRGWVVAVSPTAGWLPDLLVDGILKDTMGAPHPHPHMKVNVLYNALRFLRRLRYPYVGIEVEIGVAQQQLWCGLRHQNPPGRYCCGCKQACSILNVCRELYRGVIQK